jgi:3-phosphoshikimate 1-carboxyvinyltransferase
MTEPRTYPDKLEVRPLDRPLAAEVRVPGSKSMTNRALVLAALCSRTTSCHLVNVLRSEDTEVMVESLRRLGFALDVDWESYTIHVRRHESPRLVPAESANLFVANSGTTMRFLAAAVAAGNGRYGLDGVQRMRERPIEDLLTALRQLGCDAWSESDNGCPPVGIRATGLSGGIVSVRSDVSSQFLSGLLMAAPFAQADLDIRIDGRLVSEPYVEMTVAMMRHWGFQVSHASQEAYRCRAPQQGGRDEYHIEADASAASYFLGAGAISPGYVAVLGGRRESLQGDAQFVDVLQRMGCEVRYSLDSPVVRGGRSLRGIDVDMNAISDTVMTLAVVACFADGPTTIRNVAHIRHKETDRLAALATELRRLGADVDEFADGLTITPRPLRGAEVETYDDHRMAMSLALIGLRVPGVVIKNPGCVAKTYPGFWEDLEKLRT